MKMLKKVIVSLAISGGVLLLANTDWDKWKQDAQAGFSKNMTEEMTNARSMIESKRALTREDKLVIIGQALLELDKINTNIRTMKYQKDIDPIQVAAIIEELKDQRIQIYNAVMAQCGDVLVEDTELQKAVYQDSHSAF